MRRTGGDEFWGGGGRIGEGIGGIEKILCRLIYGQTGEGDGGALTSNSKLHLQGWINESISNEVENGKEWKKWEGMDDMNR